MAQKEFVSPQENSTLDDTTDSFPFYNDGFLSSGQLYDVPISLLIFLCVAYGAVSLAAVVGNSSVLYFVVRKKRLRSVTNMFIANLATADILIGSFAIPFQFLSALLQRWILPSFMCPFCTFVQIVSVNVSIFTLTAIAADRYMIVANPINKRVTKVLAKKIIIIIWVIALLAASPAGIALQVNFVPDMKSNPLMGEKLQEFLSNYSFETSSNLSLIFKPVCDNYGLDPLLWQWYNRFLVLIQYIIPVSFLVVTYGQIGLRLRNSGSRDKNEEHGIHEASSSTSQSQRRGTETRVVIRKGQSVSESAENIACSKRKILKTLVTIVALFALCWLPLQTYSLLSDFFPSINEFRYINVIWFLCHFLAMSNSCVNPFVYAIYTVSRCRSHTVF